MKLQCAKGYIPIQCTRSEAVYKEVVEHVTDGEKRSRKQMCAARSTPIVKTCFLHNFIGQLLAPAPVCLLADPRKEMPTGQAGGEVAPRSSQGRSQKRPRLAAF